MAGYELPVTRVPGLGSMDQIGAALGSGPSTDYLGNVTTPHKSDTMNYFEQRSRNI